jgi:uncharacterized protein
MKPINRRIAEELGVREQQVAAAISLLDGGATVPFVARYRKEATGALDDAQLRTLDERLRYLRELDERRAVILESISLQGKLDAALRHAIDAADSKARLEDLYLPYRPKRRTKAQIAREAGLDPLAEALLTRPDQSPEQMACGYVDPSKGVVDSAAALEGARAILVERFSEDAMLIGTLREEVWSRGRLSSRVRKGKAEPGAKFADYFEFSESLAKLPSHRILASFRGEKEEVLTLELVPDPTAPDRGEPGAFERQIANRFKIADHGRPGDRWLIDTVGLAWPDEDPGAHRKRPAPSALASCRRCRSAGVRREPARPVARRPCGRASDNGARSGLSDWRQSRRGDRDRPSRGGDDDLPA